MNHPVHPSGIAPPAAAYELAVVSPAGSRLLHSAGIVGTRPDGSIATDVREQAAEIWRTVDTLLTAAGFVSADIVSHTTYVVAGEDLAAVMAARDRYFAGHRAASTLVLVPALAQPQWKVEVAVVAAGSDPTDGVDR